MDDDIIQVPENVMGLVIGRGGFRINKIRKETGAEIETCRGKICGFYVRGTKMQCSLARRSIEEITKNETPLELLYIPEHLKKYFIGTGGYKLKIISERTGARLTTNEDGKIFLSGDSEARDRAHVYLKNELVSLRLISKAREGTNIVLYSSYLEEPTKADEKRIVFKPISKGYERARVQYQYTLITDPLPKFSTLKSSDCMTTNYLQQLQDNITTVLQCAKDRCLNQPKEQIYPVAELWCHFGSVLFSRVSEGDASKKWKVSELLDIFSSVSEVTRLRPKWGQKFQQGVSTDVQTLKQILEPKSDHCQRGVTRWDLTFLSPSAQRLKCKLWLLEKCGEDDANPCDLSPEFLQQELRYAVSELNFKETSTHERARGWLLRGSRPRLKTNIVSPHIGIDCRLMISTGNLSQ